MGTTLSIFSTIKILGIKFFNEKVDNCYSYLKMYGGLLTVPSGPGLASIYKDPVYYQSLLNSDLVIADSGYMALIWNNISKEKVKRISGLAFINYFVEAYPTERDFKQVFLVNPTPEDQSANLSYFQSFGISISTKNCYIAPMYQQHQIIDNELLKILELQMPHWIYLNIGGGVQEILGSWLKDNLSYKPAIICTGAAIAFKTGRQVDIPLWADKFYLGWLFRILSSPSKYYKRYLDALPLASILLNDKFKRVR
jgi:N-acetylglucosaminyldiphosphoundecaprenol N-acetyl-beta-D-mannosaminyltransferase